MDDLLSAGKTSATATACPAKKATLSQLFGPQRVRRAWNVGQLMEASPTVNVRILVNPKAGAGRAAEKGRQLQKLLGAELKTSQSSNDLEKLARQARYDAVDVVVAVGGDGTISQCTSGLVLEKGKLATNQTRLALVPAGTGGDFRRSYSIDHSLDAVATRIEAGTTRKIDVGLLRAGAASERCSTFVNVLSFGLGGLTDRFVEGGPKWLGGRAAFFLAALRANAVYAPAPIELALDEVVVETAPYSNVAVCNGQFFGGGMQIAPMADPHDGYFDVVTMELSKLKTLSLAARIYQGTHLEIPGVRHFRCKTVRARATRAAQILIDSDGEQLGSLPLCAELLPAALSLCC